MTSFEADPELVYRVLLKDGFGPKEARKMVDGLCALKGFKPVNWIEPEWLRE